MRRMEILAHARGRSAADVYPLLCDFERWPRYSDAIRAVSVTARGGDRLASTWEVAFRQGILRWTEEDRLEPGSQSIHFRQTSGDAGHFAGTWAVSDEPQGCRIRFTAEFDLGIPTMSDLLDPIAEEAMRDNIHSILTGLLGGAVEFASSDGGLPGTMDSGE